MPPRCDSVNVAGYAVAVNTSVLMAVYGGDDPDQFELALASIFNQTLPPDQIVLVVDGPVPSALQQVIDRALDKFGNLDVVQLEKNAGLVAALNAGLRECKGELILRMDADDFALPDRIRVQVEFMTANPDIGLLGSAVEEFAEDHEKPTRIKRMPLGHAEIMRALPFRNPINHPTVCLRREILPAEGYPDLKYVEDYFLWSRLAARGVRFENLRQPLVRYRFSGATVQRRSGWENFRNEMKLRVWMYRHDLMSLPGVVGVGLVQAVVRFSPGFVQQLLWRITRSAR